MYIFKNALISITRNKGRNILIGIIILVIACASTITLAINNTASDLIGSYQSAYDKELTITFNRENMMKDVDFSKREKLDDVKSKFDKISSYTISDVEKYAESDYIEDYYYTYNISLNGNTIKKAESETTNKNSNMPGFPGGGMDKKLGGSSYDFTLNGYSSLDAMSEFIEGSYEMVEIADDAWDKAFNGNYIFINEELASYNNLKLNDTVEFKDQDNKTYKFTIIGIYKENESGASAPVDIFASSANTVITNANALTAITKANSNVKGSIDPIFIIRDYGDKDQIEAEFHDKGLNENFTVETNEETATAGLSSIQNVKSFASAFLVITLVIGSIVLLVINMINIRERKYEIGVLRTIGVSKSKLTMQFVSELLIVGFVALIVGAGVGAVMSKNVSNSLLANEISSSKAASEKIAGNFGGPGPMGGGRPGSTGNSGSSSSNGSDSANGGSNPMPSGNPSEFFGGKGRPQVEAYESIDAVVDVKVLLELLGIGLTLILISSLSAMISIQRFTPLTILKERS